MVGEQPQRSSHNGELTVHEASNRYNVSKMTLQARLRRGEMPATKVRGARGYEWRVHADALEAFGYRLRDAPPATDALIEDVLRELLAISDALIAEQQRAADQQRSIEAMRQQIHQLRRTMHEVLQSERSKRVAAATGEEAQRSSGQSGDEWRSNATTA